MEDWDIFREMALFDCTKWSLGEGEGKDGSDCFGFGTSTSLLPAS